MQSVNSWKALTGSRRFSSRRFSSADSAIDQCEVLHASDEALARNARSKDLDARRVSVLALEQDSGSPAVGDAQPELETTGSGSRPRMTKYRMAMYSALV